MTKQEKRLAAIHHVVHDYANLVSSGALTQAGPAAKAGVRPPVNTHIQHAFLLNCRKLADFLQRPPKGDDIAVENFLGKKESFSLPVWNRWGKLGEYAAAFTKGAHICVEGELRSREYESNGAKVRTYDIVASSIINLRAGQRNQAETPDPAEAAA
jgi:hypothetical protein